MFDRFGGREIHYDRAYMAAGWVRAIEGGQALRTIWESGSPRAAGAAALFDARAGDARKRFPLRKTRTNGEVTCW